MGGRTRKGPNFFLLLFIHGFYILIWIVYWDLEIWIVLLLIYFILFSCSGGKKTTSITHCKSCSLISDYWLWPSGWMIGETVGRWIRKWLERFSPQWTGDNDYSLSWLQILLAHHGTISQRQLVCRASRRLHGLRRENRRRFIDWAFITKHFIIQKFPTFSFFF